MKRAATFTVFLKKIVIFSGVCIILNASPAFAQNNNQATTLLELQALRQEVAELRDMVERQQYEMRELKSGLESAAESSEPKKPSPKAVSTLPTPPQNNAVPNILNGNPSTIGTLGSTLGSTPNVIPSGVASPNVTSPSITPPNNTAQAPSSLNYQSGTGRLSVPKLGQTGTTPSNNTTNPVNNAINQANTRLNNAQQSIPTIPSGNGAIDASNIPTPPSSLNNRVQGALNGSQGTSVPNSTLGQLGQTTQPRVQPNTNIGVANTVNGASRQAQRVFPTTPVNPTSNQAVNSATRSAQSNLPGARTAAGIRPIETIQSGPSSLPLANSGQALQGVGAQNVLSENDYYQQGFNLLKESKHDEAVAVFQKQIKQYPQGELADDAYYWVAESLYVTRKLDASKESFRAVLQGYPKSDRAPDAMLKLAYIEQEQGNIIESRILLQEIVQFHPQSDAALSAKNRLSQIN